MFSEKRHREFKVLHNNSTCRIGYLKSPEPIELSSGRNVTLRVMLTPDLAKEIKTYEFLDSLSHLKTGQNIHFSLYKSDYSASHINSIARVVTKETKNGIKNMVFLDWDVCIN